MCISLTHSIESIDSISGRIIVISEKMFFNTNGTVTAIDLVDVANIMFTE
jgi:hypothetical protein